MGGEKTFTLLDPWPGRSFGTEIFFFLLRTALRDRPKGPSTANRQLPPTANRPPPTHGVSAAIFGKPRYRNPFLTSFRTALPLALWCIQLLRLQSVVVRCIMRENTATPRFRTVGPLWHHRFCGPNAMENVVCSRCAGCRRGLYGCPSVGVAVPCALMFWGVCWAAGHRFVVMKGEGWLMCATYENALPAVRPQCKVFMSANTHFPYPISLTLLPTIPIVCLYAFSVGISSIRESDCSVVLLHPHVLLDVSSLHLLWVVFDTCARSAPAVQSLPICSVECAAR